MGCAGVPLSLRGIVVCLQQGETYRWAVCKEPLPLVEMRHVGIPLPAKHVEVLHSSLAWEDLQVPTLIPHWLLAAASPTLECMSMQPDRYLVVGKCTGPMAHTDSMG